MQLAARTFAGGYRFKGFDGQPREALVEFAVPERIILSSNIPFLVEAGDAVKAGQIIARDDDSPFSPSVSSVNGAVEEISDVSGESVRGYRITIRSDGTPQWQSFHAASWADLSEEEIEERLTLSGAAAAASESFPSRRGGCPVRPEQVRHIIVRDTESDVFNLSPALFLRGEGAARCACALALLKRIMPSADLHLALSRDRRALLADFRKAAADYGLNVRLAGLHPKFPQDHEAVISRTLLQEDHAYNHGTAGRGSALRHGVLVLDLQALAQIYDAVVKGKPAVDREIGLAGPGWSSNFPLRVRIGTPVREILRYYPLRDPGSRLIFDSALTGPQVAGVKAERHETGAPKAALSKPERPESEEPNASIGPRTSLLIALPQGESQIFSFMRPGVRKDSYARAFFSNFLPSLKSGFVSLAKTTDVLVHGEPRPCITCTFCDQVCPVRIHPHLLHRYVKKDLVDETLLRYQIFRCIECNLCSYVCPSKIPVAALLKRGKRKLLQEGYDPKPYGQATPMNRQPNPQGEGRDA